MFYLTLRDSETRHKNVVDGLASFERLEMVSNMHGAKLFARNKKHPINLLISKRP